VTYRVRHAEPKDAARLVQLAQEIGAEDEGWLITAGDWRSAWDERRYLRTVRRHRDAAVLVAETNGTVIGRLSIARDSHPASEHVADLGVMVDREHRRRGVGTALMAAAEEWARGAGIRKIELHVFPHNEPALALYERLGYAREGLRRNHYRRPDGFVDAILMAKELT
jgi:RimJ/RimL family protein N-acetyltransferase